MAEIESLSEGLVFISETDAPVTAFGARGIGDASAESIAHAAAISNDATPEVRPASLFFERVSAMKEWYGDKETERAKTFAELYDLLNEGLRDLRTYRFGQVRVDIIVAGNDGEGNAAGIRTFAVET